MRILITTDAIGGVWRFTQELATGLLEAGDSVVLISFGVQPSIEQQGHCIQLASTWGEAFRYTASDLPLEWMQNNERCFEAGAALLAETTLRFVPDLVHSNQFCFGALRFGIPKIVTAHSDVLSWARARRDRTLEDSPWLARYRAMVQAGLDGADTVTAPTRWMQRALGEGFDLHDNVCVIPNGRDVPCLSARARRLQAVTAGRLWDEAKDVALLGEISSTMPIIVAGETACQGASLPALHGVKLAGPLAESELLQLFRESAVYVCTSRYEPFGLAPLEAALCGCAIVARRIESLEEVWGDAALYFRDAEDLSELLTWLYEDERSLRKAQQQSFARARLYARKPMVASYRALYAEVAEMAGVS